MKRLLSWRALAVVGVVLAALVISYRLGRARLGLALAERVIEARLGANLLEELPDGLHVGLCGTGSPMPDPTRAGPCTAVIAGRRLFVVDSGTGSTRNLALMGLRPGDIEAVLLTHFHSDHIADLGELLLQRWAGGARHAPTPVYGPDGVAAVVDGLVQEYALDARYRVAHHGAEVVPPAGAGGEARVVALEDRPTASAVLLDDGGLRITMFRVDHRPVEPAVGYRFDYHGRSVVLSGDTRRSISLVQHAHGADLLVHEGLQPALVGLIREAATRLGQDNVAKIADDILSYHTSPEEAAEVATEAGVGALVFSHVIPPLPAKLLEAAFLGDAQRRFAGPIHVGHDGELYSLPANGDGIAKRATF